MGRSGSISRHPSAGRAWLALAMVLSVLVPWSMPLTAKQMVGWVEWARLEPSGLRLKAKLDTGAKHSSLSTTRMVFSVLDGSRYVRFRVTDTAGESVELIEPVLRSARIKEHGSDPVKRPVVMLTICVAGVRKAVEVNLMDRSGFNYPLLIGRSFLAGDFVVDAAQTFTLKPRCGPAVAE